MLSSAFVFPLLCLCAVAYAGSSTQTDWSGGYQYPSLEPDWGVGFLTGSGADYCNAPGSLRLTHRLTPLAGFYPGPSRIGSGDFDGDGDEDIFLKAGTSPYTFSWLENTGPTTHWPLHPAGYDLSSGIFREGPDIADFDGDGDLDAALMLGYPGRATWLENPYPSGGDWTAHAVSGPPSYPDIITAVDIDGDGLADISGVDEYHGWVAWWENPGGGDAEPWVVHEIDPDVAYPSWISPADMDSDGDQDLLVSRDDTSGMGILRWYENAGAPWDIWPMHVISDQLTRCSFSAECEMDGSPGPEILAAAWASGMGMMWFRQDSPGVWTGHPIAGPTDVLEMYPCDLDADGDPDICVETFGGDYVIWNQPGFWMCEAIPLYFSGEILPMDTDWDGEWEMVISGAGYPDTFTGIASLELDEYADSGFIESHVLDTGSGQEWGWIGWSTQSPEDTDIAFQVRSGAVFTLMREWSGIITAPCSLVGILVEGDRYLQYRVMLSSSHAALTPVLDDVTVTWDPLVINVGDSCEAWFLGPCPNPVAGASVFSVHLTAAVQVRVDVVDLTGRTVASPIDGDFEAGSYEAVLPELIPGMYFLRVSAGEESACRRFTVLERSGA